MKKQICTLMVFCCGFMGVKAQKVSEIGKEIPKSTAEEWITNFNNSNPESVLGYMYGKEMLTSIMVGKGAEGIRVYFGLTENKSTKLIFQAADDEGRGFGYYYDDGSDCPPFCPKDPPNGQNNVIKTGNRISDESAQNWITNYNNTNPFVKSVLFGKDIIETVMNQDNAAGIYFANGLDINNNLHLVLIGIDKNGSLMKDGPYGNDGSNCPPDCPPPSSKDNDTLVKKQ